VKKRHLILSVAISLALASNAAWSLGLGQLQVKSGLNQPLVAEIPIIASSPGEIENLEVRLASPEAFERVGLVRPTHSTANLSFSVGKNARGQSVVLITSSGKFVEPFLSFLIEADWGRGTVTKEYTALIDPPYIAKAIIRPLEAPTVAVAPTQVAPVAAPLPMENTIKLTPPAESAPAPQPMVEAPNTALEPGVPVTTVTDSQELPPEMPTPAPVAAIETQAEPAPSPVVAEATPAPTPMPAPVMAAPEAAPVQAIELEPNKEYGPVAAGETLSKIAGKLNPDADNVSIRQMMMALLKANPDAFIDDNVNQLKRGAVMRIPGRDEASSLSDEQASALIAEQSAAWNRNRAPVLQPTETVTQTNPQAQPEVAQQPAPEPAPVAQAQEPSVPKPAPPRRVSAKPVNSSPRLEIVPPSKKAIAAKTVQSGAAAGAGGTELRAELTQAREDVAVRDTQINELKSRVTDLETQETKRQQLIELQNSQLKALQDELAKRQATPAAVPAPVAAAPETLKPVADDKPATPPVVSEPAWYLNPLLHYVAGGALLLGGLIWMFRRRREPKEEAVIGGRRISDDVDFQASLAAMKSSDLPAAAINTSVQPAYQEMTEAAAQADKTVADSPMVEDEEWTRLSNQLRSKPQDLDAHLAVLRHHYRADDAASFEVAAKAMQAQVSTVLDPRWREAVVMGGIISPGNAMFSQADWNTPRFTDSNVASANSQAATSVSTPSFVKQAEAKAQAHDITQVGMPSAWDAKPETNTVTPIEEIGPFTEDNEHALSSANEDLDLDGDEGEEADLMVSDPSSSTKIELASAYLDIGDVEGARSMLEEVVEHGTKPAKRLATRLLKEIG
jgi:pilus assembly protein FimV